MSGFSFLIPGFDLLCRKHFTASFCNVVETEIRCVREGGNGEGLQH